MSEEHASLLAAAKYFVYTLPQTLVLTFPMSMLLAGGGLRHGGALGATDARGGEIRQRHVTPADLAASIFLALGIDVSGTLTDALGRPFPVNSGTAIPWA